jgi:cytochrome c oxidase cbb3-type subunit III
MRHSGRVLRTAVVSTVMAVLTIVSVAVSGQGRGGGAAQPPTGAPAPQGRGVAPPDRPGPNDRMVVDPAEVDKARAIWSAECVTCHGANARGGDGGPNLVRSPLVLHDRYGSGLGPFLKEGHPMQSGKPSSSLSDAQVVQLSHFLRQRILDTLRSSPLFDVQNVLTGDPKGGAAYFNGEGKCATCHSATGDLAGIGTRLTPVNIQQRFIFPFGGGRGRGAAPPSPRTAITVTVTPPGQPAVTGVRMEEDDFHVTLREPSGAVRTLKRTPGTTVTTTNPLQFHIDLLERITDKQMHDVVAYLETLK